MIPVIETSAGDFEEVTTFEVVDSLDGERRAHMAAIVSEAFAEEERAEFGVFLVEPAAVPDGKSVTATRYVRIDGQVVQQIDVEDTPILVPHSVSPRQLKLALLGAGLLDEIEAFVATPAVPRAAQISWEYATEYQRDDPMLNQMAGMLDPPMSAEQIDQLFIAAAAIP